MALQAAPLIGTTEPSDSVPRGFDKHFYIRIILSLKRTTKKIHKVLQITLLQFLTLSCQAVTKGHTYFNKPAESCRSV